MFTLKYLNECFSYSPKDGVLTWRKRPDFHFKARPESFNKRWAGKEAGSINGEGYRLVEIMGKTHKVHKIVWAMVTGEWPKDSIDHINGNRSDNRICNLRCVSRAENARNQRRPKNNTSGVIGVNWHKNANKWRAAIGINGQKKSLGYFCNKDEAIEARRIAERQHGYHPNHGSAG